MIGASLIPFLLLQQLIIVGYVVQNSDFHYHFLIPLTLPLVKTTMSLHIRNVRKKTLRASPGVRTTQRHKTGAENLACTNTEIIDW